MIIDLLRQEHRNIDKLLLVLEQELRLFARGERPDYEVIRAVIAYFEVYPDAYHHPQEDMVFKKLKARDPAAAASVGDLAAEHQSGAERLRRVAQAVQVEKSYGKRSTALFATSSHANGSTWPWKSASSFRLRSWLCNPRTGRRLPRP